MQRRKLFFRKKDFAVLGVFCLALFVRILYNVTVARGYLPAYDAALYSLIATHLLTEHCYCIANHIVTVSRAPLWPFIMAGIYFFMGPNNFYARLFYCFLGSGTCLFIYHWADDLFGKRIALSTGILAAMYAGLFIYDGWLFSESLYTFCLVAFAYALYQLQCTALPADKLPSGLFSGRCIEWCKIVFKQRWIYMCSLFLALATLTRSNGLSLLGLLGVWAVIVILTKMVPWQTAVSSSCVIAIIALLLITPWTYRNFRVVHTFVPVATGVGEVLSGAYNDKVLHVPVDRRGYWNPPDHTIIHDLPSFTMADEKEETERALTWIRTHLNEMPYVLSLHFINLWRPYVREFARPSFPFEEFPQQLSSKIIVAFVLPVMSISSFILACLGLLTTWMRRKKQLLVVYLTLALTVMLNVVFYSNMRFRAPMEPFIVLCVGGFLWWLTSNESGTLRSALRQHQQKQEM